MRDWTDSAALHDRGQEPSVRSNFYSTSDVWNRRNNNPGGFTGADRPQSQDPRPASMGHNWAFVRVSREAAGTAEDVTVRFLYSDGGVGVPYVSAGPPITLHFHAGDLEKTLSPGGGYQWDLPSGASNHVCLAVEIETAADPLIPPGLLGHAPGWPTTDLLVVADNNKAQRNMNVFTMGGMGALSQKAVAYALVGNAAKRMRDVVLGLDVDPKRLEELRGAAVRIVGGPGPEIQRVTPKGVLVVPAMEPGETRWLELAVTASERLESPLEITVNELVGPRSRNGYAFQLRPTRLAEALAATLFQHEALFRRLTEAFRLEGAEELADRARELRSQETVDPDRYRRFLYEAQQRLVEVARQLVREGGRLGDPFGTVEAAAELTADREPGAVQVAHLSLLNKLDALATHYQRARAKSR